MIAASIQARMGSSRLPGKVLTKICGKPMLLWQIERIRRSRIIDKVIVGTSTSPLDDEIAYFCENNGVDCYRGPEENVLKRIACLIRDLDVETHVECYGDSPLVDPQIIDEFVGFYLKNKHKFDCVSNSFTTTYPPGLEVTVYPGQVLLQVDQMVSSDDPLREHVGYNITRFPESFRLKALEAPSWFFSPETYLEVDTDKDLDFMKAVIGHFVSEGQEHFGLGEILGLLRKNPDLALGNKDEERRWKIYRKTTTSNV